MSDPNKAVFLSYASQDAEAAKRICEALRAAGVEVWFDADGGLEHGDEWDAKIRRQIKECVLFIPVISANTQAREEGYFRIEWELAAQRALGIASGVPFILPVVIDDTREPNALVPDRFRVVQWTRLRGGEVPADVQQRFLKLWSHRTGVLKYERREMGRPRPAERDEGVAFPDQQKVERRVPAAAWVVAAAVVALAVGGYFLLKHPGNSAPTTAQNASAATVRPASERDNAPASEVRALTARAQALFANPNYTRDDLALAEDLCQQAIKLAPGDADVWAIYAELSGEFIGGGTDNSNQRKEAARVQAERAVKLAPDSAEASFAKASYLRRMGGTSKMEAEKILRELVTRLPGDPRVITGLAKTIWGNIGGARNLQRADEALALLDQAALIPAGRAEALRERGWLLWNLGRNAEAEAALDASLALQPAKSATTLKVYLARDRGDLEIARRSLAQLPPDVLRGDQGSSLAAGVWLWSREPDRCLEVLGPITRDYLSSNMFTGPTDLLRGQAFQLAGKVEAARNAWQAALQVVEKRLVNQPHNGDDLLNRAYLLALLGERDAATALRLYEEVASDGPGRSVNDAVIHVLLDPPDQVIPMLEGMLKTSPPRLSMGSLRANPAFDPLRADPRFQALLAGPKTSAALSTVPDEKSVAVLAFANLSDDKANEYFSDGISEELISLLGRVPGLTVKGSTSAFYFKHKEDQFSSAEIARQLGVAYLVRGSVRKAGDQVRITAQLTRAATDEMVWSSEPLTREVKDVFSVQEEVARLIAEKLQLKLNGAAAARAAINPEAYEFYLQARQAWNLRNADGYDRAEKLLGQSIALAPDFAPAHAALVDVWTTRGQDDRSISRWGLRNSPAVARIIEKSHQAIALDPTSAESHAALGGLFWTLWQWPAGERELREAIRLNPNYASAHQWLGRNLMTQGRLDEALAELKQAAELDPLSPRILDNTSLALLNAQRPTEALGFADRALRLQPNAEQALAMKAIALAMVGESDAAAAAVRSLPAHALHAEIALVTAGRVDAAVALLASIPQDNVEAKIAGLIGMGHTDEALAALKPELLESGKADLLLFNPVFDPLRSEPRFREVLQTVGLAEAHARAQAWRKAHPPEKPEAKK